MPIPFIIGAIKAILYIGGCALAGGVVGGVVGLVIGTLIEKLSGKVVTVIGERSSGKTTLATFLSSGEIPEEYEQTLAEKKFPGRTLKLSDLKLTINEITDLPGSKDFYNKWKAAVTKSHLVYYLARADWIMDKTETRKRVLADVKHLIGWLSESPGKTIFFVGTHCDLIPDYTKLTPANMGDFQDTFFKNEEMKEVALLLCNVDAAMILGSLVTERDIQRVVHQSFQKIQLDKK
jgi:GTPase SAR1 family protein